MTLNRRTLLKTSIAAAAPGALWTPARAAGVADKELVLGTHLDLFQRIIISTCSISAIGFSGDGPMALTVNSTGGALSDLVPS